MHIRIFPIVLLVAAGCATNPEVESVVEITELEPLPSIGLVPTLPVTECQIARAARGAMALQGTLHLSGNLLSAGDGNGHRDTVVLEYRRPDGDSTDIRFELVQDSTCEVVARLPTDASSPDFLEWDGKLNGKVSPAGVYLVQAVSDDGRTRGPSARLFVVEEDDPCDVPGAEIEWVHAGTVSPAEADRGIVVDRQGPLHLCVQLRNRDGSRMLPGVSVNGYPVVNRITAQGHNSIRFGMPSYGSAHRLDFDSPSGAVEIRVGLLPGQAPERTPFSGDDSALENTRGPGCYGRLFGFRHPFRAGLPDAVQREAVVIRCRYYYFKSQTNYAQDANSGAVIEHSQSIAVPVEALGYTDSEGRFAIELPQSGFDAIGVNRYQPPDGTDIDCADYAECGRETRALGGVPGMGPEEVGLFGIPQIAAAGFVARLVTGHRPTTNDLGVPERLVDPARGDLTASAPNDLPVVVHEAFDPLLEDGTRRLAWFLNGQIIDHQRLDEAGLSDSPCEDPFRGPCLHCLWTIECDQQRLAALNDPSVRAGDRYRCHAPNQLLQLVGNGYDVWLVDSINRDASIYELAAGALHLYQEILDYGGEDPDRRLALAGLSLGGIIGKVALRTWEVLDAQHESGTVTLLELGDGVRLPHPSTLKYSPDRAALYISFDAPHLGARLPEAFQAYVKDANFAGGPRLPNLLNSTPARELLKRYVLPQTDTPCWGEGENRIGDCTLAPPLDGNANVDAPAIDTGSVLVDRTIEKFADLPPGVADPTGFGTGLPRTIPAVALTNGSLTRNPEPVSNTVLDVRFDLLVSDYRHLLRDSLEQPLGSGLDTFCSAKELETEEELVNIFEYLYADCRETSGGLFDWVPIVGSTAGQIFCAVGGAIGGMLDGGFRGNEVGITADIEIPMRPRPDGTGQFPTFIETTSALALRPRLTLGSLPWIDYSTRPVSVSHFSVDDEQCRFIMYHLDGHMKGDRDGYPACGPNANGACLSGGRQPGARLDPGGRWSQNARNFCDPNDSDPRIVPLEIRLREIRERTTLISIP